MSDYRKRKTQLFVAGIAVLSTAAISQAASFDGKSRVSSIYVPGYSENAGSTSERENYRTLYLGQGTSGNRDLVDTYHSNGRYINFNDISAGDTFVLGQISYTNGLETIDNTTPEVLRNVIVAQLNGSYRQFQIDVNVDNGENGGLDTISIDPNGALSTDYTAVINGVNYTFELLGFGQSADDINTSVSSGDLGSTVNFNLYGQLVDYNQYLVEQAANTIAVPTPAAASFGLAALAVLMIRRKKDN